MKNFCLWMFRIYPVTIFFGVSFAATYNFYFNSNDEVQVPNPNAVTITEQVKPPVEPVPEPTTAPATESALEPAAEPAEPAVETKPEETKPGDQLSEVSTRVEALEKRYSNTPRFRLVGGYGFSDFGEDPYADSSFEYDYFDDEDDGIYGLGMGVTLGLSFYFTNHLNIGAFVVSYADGGIAGAELELVVVRAPMGKLPYGLELAVLGGASNWTGEFMPKEILPHVGARLTLNFTESWGITSSLRANEYATLNDIGLVLRL